MSTLDNSRSRWLDWEPDQKFSTSPQQHPTKTTKTVSDVFVGPSPARIENISVAPEAARALLGRIGARLVIFRAGDLAIGVWSDLDSAAVRAAIGALGLDELPVLYLDSERCPAHYKIRHVPGEPVSLSVLKAMEAAQSMPWQVRDELLRVKGTHRKSK